jgi:ribosomal protein L11 methyltransferase
VEPAPEHAYVTTTGRRSGRSHTVELWCHLDGRTAWFLHTGGPADWIANALAGPVTFRLGDGVWGGTARLAEPGTEIRRALGERYDSPQWAVDGLGLAIELGPPAEPTVRVVVGPDDVDGVSGRLWLAGAYAVAEEPGVLVAGFADRAAAEAAAADVGGEVVDVLPGAWLDAWRAFAQPVRAGRVVVVPAWVDAPPTGPDDVVLEIDPGRVFGHGGHPTTRLLLEELDRRITGGESVLDVGTGSGVLAVAAKRLGAGRVAGIDIDPECVPVTTANAERAGVEVEVSTTPLAEVTGTYDLVLANIGADVLVELAPLLQARGRVLLLSGLLEDRIDDVAAAYAGTATASTLDGWAALTVSVE